MIVRLLVCAALQAPVQGPLVAVDAVSLESPGARFFSGQQIRVPIRYYGGQGQRFDLRARPYQLAHALAAPVGPAIEVAANVELGGAAWRDFSLTLDCPAVNRIAIWELHHQIRTVEEDTWRSVGTTRIELYPPDLLQPLRKLATTRQWFVSDRPGRLKAFLTEHGIAFLDLDGAGGRQAFERQRAGKEHALVLWVREPADPGRSPPADRRTPRWMSGPGQVTRVLVFEEPSPALPCTVIRLEPHRTRISVDIELLSSLTDDPRAQMRLVEAVRMTQFDLEASDE